MTQLYWLCVIGTVLMATAFWFWLDEPMVRYAMVGSVVLSSAVFAWIVGRGMRRQKRTRQFLKENGIHLGFVYEAGERSLGADGRVRGQLHCFRRKDERDVWISEAEAGGKRRAVSHLKLPNGWQVFDALPGMETETEDEAAAAVDDDEHGDDEEFEDEDLLEDDDDDEAAEDALAANRREDGEHEEADGEAGEDDEAELAGADDDKVDADADADDEAESEGDEDSDEEDRARDGSA